ncbi:uncharacterized protein M6B38_371100 [Iris pallida]|uniref:Uncharacterized protein n=1 Tax=Iris pallida TaxID=29817 RepID=A0AAX6GD85_IRIPA|nr:uncharacterized protein M6B38_371100 [Iris pallida]
MEVGGVRVHRGVVVRTRYGRRFAAHGSDGTGRAIPCGSGHGGQVQCKGDARHKEVGAAQHTLDLADGRQRLPRCGVDTGTCGQANPHRRRRRHVGSAEEGRWATDVWCPMGMGRDGEDQGGRHGGSVRTAEEEICLQIWATRSRSIPRGGLAQRRGIAARIHRLGSGCCLAGTPPEEG